MTTELDMNEVEKELNEQLWFANEAGDEPATEAPLETPDLQQEAPKEEPTKEQAPQTDEEKKKSGAAKLLAQRNQARDALKTREQEIAQLKEELKALKAKDLSEDDDAREHDLSIIEKTSELKAIEREKKFMSEQYDSKFFEETPEALEVKDQIQAIRDEHPTLSPDDAYSLLLNRMWVVRKEEASKPSEPSEQEINQSKSYDLLGTSTSSTATAEKSIDKMTTAELDAYIRKLDSEGKLSI